MVWDRELKGVVLRRVERELSGGLGVGGGDGWANIDFDTLNCF